MELYQPVVFGKRRTGDLSTSGVSQEFEETAVESDIHSIRYDCLYIPRIDLW